MMLILSTASLAVQRSLATGPIPQMTGVPGLTRPATDGQTEDSVEKGMSHSSAITWIAENSGLSRLLVFMGGRLDISSRLQERADLPRVFRIFS